MRHAETGAAARAAQSEPGRTDAMIQRAQVERVQLAQEAAQARIEREVQRAREEVSRAVGRPAPGERGAMSVLRDEQGRIVVELPNGQRVVIDPRVVPSEGAQQMIIEHALAAFSAPPPPPPPFEQGPPERVIELVSVVLLFLTLMLVGFPLARAAARRMDRKGVAPSGGGVPADLAVRLDRLEQSVDGVAVEIERVAEAQRFSARLLSERLPEALPRLEAAHAAAQAAQAARGEGPAAITAGAPSGAHGPSER